MFSKWEIIHTKKSSLNGSSSYSIKISEKRKKMFFHLFKKLVNPKEKLMAHDPDPFLGWIKIKWIKTSHFRRRRWSLSLEDPGASTPPTRKGYRTGQVYLLPGKYLTNISNGILKTMYEKMYFSTSIYAE